MKYTLLELVQNVLSSMDSDEVNSITDTVESQQVVAIIKTVYDDIISRSDLTTHKVLFNLDASTDGDKPVIMTKPQNIERIDWIKYNKILSTGTDPEWSEVRFLPIQDFVDYVYQLSPYSNNVRFLTHIADGFTLTFYFRYDTAPCYYTTLDDNTLIFDAYDDTVDAVLQSSKSLGFGNKKTDFEESDVFIPSLQAHQFALLLNEAKSLAWAELKQVPHQKAERTARRNWVHLSKTRQNIPSGKFLSGSHAFDQLPNFSRK